MVPNYRLTPVKISSAPFTTQVVTGRAPNSWSNQVQTRFYVYPIHPSGSYIQTDSLASALYLVLVHLLNREYQQAAPLIATCHTDMKFNTEERWIMNMFKRDEKDQDKHPDAHACRLMLALVCLECGESTKDIFDVKEDYKGYVKKNAHVSQACRLTIEDEQLLLTTIQDQQRRLFLSCVDKRRKLDKKEKKTKKAKAKAASIRLKSTSSASLDHVNAEVNAEVNTKVDTTEVVDYECNGIMVGGRRLGIMYRNSKDKFDKFDGVMGPMPGDVVTPSGPVDENDDPWIPVDLPLHGRKWLPIELNSTKVFSRVESMEARTAREKEEQEKRYTTASELLFTGFDHELCMEAMEMCNDNLSTASQFLTDFMGREEEAKLALTKWRTGVELKKQQHRTTTDNAAVSLSFPGAPCKNGGIAHRINLKQATQGTYSRFKPQQAAPAALQQAAPQQAASLNLRYSYLYHRPHPTGGVLKGAEALAVLEKIWKEEGRTGMFMGSVTKTGFCLLYEMAMGQVQFDLVDNVEALVAKAHQAVQAVQEVQAVQAVQAVQEEENKEEEQQQQQQQQHQQDTVQEIDFSMHTEAAQGIQDMVGDDWSLKDLEALVAMHNGDTNSATNALFSEEEGKQHTLNHLNHFKTFWTNTFSLFLFVPLCSS